MNSNLLPEMIVVTERNRDGAKVWLEKVIVLADGLTKLPLVCVNEEETQATYTIHTDKDYILNYASENYDALPDDAQEFDEEYKFPDGHTVKAHVHSFDPAGGPYMHIGSEIVSGYKLLRIFANDNIAPGVLFKLEKV